MTALTPETKRAVVIGAGFIGLKWQKTCKTRIRSHSRGKAPHVLPPLDEEMAAFVKAELSKTMFK